MKITLRLVVENVNRGKGCSNSLGFLSHTKCRDFIKKERKNHLSTLDRAHTAHGGPPEISRFNNKIDFQIGGHSRTIRQIAQVHLTPTLKLVRLGPARASLFL